MRLLFLGSAALLAVGIAASLVGSQSSSEGKARSIVDTINLAFTPRGCFGNGESSPVFSVMWTAIYTLNIFSILYLTIRGFGENDDKSDRDDNMFNASGVVGAAFFLTCVWPSLFSKAYREDYRVESWPLWFSTAVSAVSAVLATVGLAWLHPGLNSDRVLGIFVGVPWSIFAGWMIAATGIGLNLAIANDNHSEHSRDPKKPSVEPALAALVAAIAAGLLGSPVLAAPMLIVCFFVSFTWASGIAGLLSVLGIIAGSVRTALV